jgi:chromosome segregation ATPase
MKYDYEKRIG